MRENWTNGQNRFKALQTQARATRDEKIILTNELAELRAQMEAGTTSNVSFFLSRLLFTSRTLIPILDRRSIPRLSKLRSPPSKPRRPLSRPASRKWRTPSTLA